MQRVSIFFYTIAIILCAELSSDNIDDFIDLFVNEQPCTSEFIDYIDNGSALKEDLLLASDQEVLILQDIFRNFCAGITPDIINPISKRIFKDNISNKNLLYAIHSSKFAYHLAGEEPSVILNILFDELILLNSIQKDDLGSGRNIANIIQNIAHGVDTFEDSEFNENVIKDPISFNSLANIMYSRLENFILNVIDETFEADDLQIIANSLFNTRIAKSNNLNYYGSPLERYGAREQIIKIYFDNYENGSIKYTEFNSLIDSKYNEELDKEFILIKPTIDQVLDLNFISTSFGVVELNSDGSYINQSDKIFEETLMQMLSDNFDEYTDDVISVIALRHVNNYKNINCSLKNKIYVPDYDSLESLSLELQLLSYKLSCIDSPEALFELLNKLTDYYLKISIYELNKEDKFDALMAASLASMFLDNFLSMDSKIELNHKNLDEFITKYIFFKETQLSVDYIKTVSSYEEILPIMTFTQSFDLISSLLGEDSSEYNEEIQNLKNNFYDLIIFDTEALKTLLLSKNTDKPEKIFIEKGLSLIGMSLLSTVSDFVPEYIELLINDFESGVDEKKYQQIQDLLEIISFYLDNIDKIFENDSPEFIWKTHSLDQWLSFKSLLSLEVTLNFALTMADLMKYEDYFSISNKRIDQIIALRPERISLEKFKSEFIKENKNISFIELIKEYDTLQKEYRELLESKIILNKDIYDIAPSEIFSLEDSYKAKLLSIQGKLFDEDDVGLLFKHESINSDAIQYHLGKNEGLLSFLSGEFFTLGVLLRENKKILFPLSLSNPGYLQNSNTILDSFTRPESNIPTKELELLYGIFFGAFNLTGLKDLYIVTDEVFSGFPFHALINIENKKWSIDEFRISYLSSEKLLPYLDKRRISKNNRFLGFGNPTLNKDTLESQIDDFFDERGDYPVNIISDLYELPDTETEISNIAKYFRKSEVFFQDDATEENLLVKLDKSIDILAFATHSVKGMSKFYNDRGLILTPENSDNYANDGFLSNQQIKFLNLDNNPIVLLTACNTIDPQYYLSLPYTGLASSFMEAGADGVLLSLWNVNSKSSSELNQGIFKNNNTYFSESLQGSIIEIKSKEEFSHPYYWAPYIYLGR